MLLENHKKAAAEPSILKHLGKGGAEHVQMDLVRFCNMFMRADSPSVEAVTII